MQALITYRNSVLRSSTPRLEHLRAKLQERSQLELAQSPDAPTEEERIGKINPREPDIVQEMRKSMRRLGMARNTEKAYVRWLRRFMGTRCLKSLADFDAIGSTDVESFLTDLAVDGSVAGPTQEQAFYSLLFLFEQVLKRELSEVNAIRADKPKRVPTVMSKPEILRVLQALSGIHLLIAQLLYGCGLRISECLRLRVMDIDFDQMQIRVYNSKGNKSRIVPLPEQLVASLKRQIQWREALHAQDLADGRASVWLPFALGKKYPNAHRQFKWQFLFASHRFSRDPQTGQFHRHHIHRDTFATHLQRAICSARVHKPVTSHTFRHSFATHLLLDNTDIRTVQELLGHSDIKTTMIYLHALIRTDIVVVSPLDRLFAAHPPPPNVALDVGHVAAAVPIAVWAHP